MRVDTNVKDKMELTPGTYTLEIVNAKETTEKRRGNAQLIVEFQVVDGPEFENGEPSEGAEVVEFVMLTFNGYDTKGSSFLKEKLQDFVAGLGKTMDEFASMEAEDLIGMQTQALVKLGTDRDGFIRAQISKYKAIAEV